MCVCVVVVVVGGGGGDGGGDGGDGGGGGGGNTSASMTCDTHAQSNIPNLARCMRPERRKVSDVK